MIRYLIMSFLVLLIISLLIMTYLLEASENNVVNQVKNGERELYCLFLGNTDFTKVDPEKVEGKFENTWEFTNGYASNCFVK